MNKRLKIKGFIFLSLLIANDIKGQEKGDSCIFPLQEVRLLEGPFKHAQDLNIETLLKYNINRLLAPYQKAAGIPHKAENYPSWESSGLDGHIGGHYLSALAIHYAATGNIQCKQRMDSMIKELKKCQEANSADSIFQGYLGGVPNGKSIWLKIYHGNPSAILEGWVPWYNVHKMYAGLRDAWYYGGNEDAKTMFLHFCDWGIKICENLSDQQMDTMLKNEYGGMNEVYADAYRISGDQKYLAMAKRFSHKEILNSMEKRVDNLDNKHANTQVAKAVGFERIAGVSKDTFYLTAAEFFWETVTQNRSLAFGGNSRREYFPSKAACKEYVTEVQGPESCNSYNMLKLTEGLFKINPEAAYVDYYERTIFNHILSTQHPEHGGYVYFTPARPQHYRVYSAPEQAMWCCVGTGMENHGKYGEFIYAHRDDTLFVNLFIASQLNWKEKGISITQLTDFPDQPQTQLIIHTESPRAFKLMIRHPSWIETKNFKIIINSDTVDFQSQPSSYICINRIWNNEDRITILLPMNIRLEGLINVPNYVAIMYGPILLGARTGKEDLAGLIADDSRWGHIASGKMIPITTAPILPGNRSTFPSKIVKIEGNQLKFKTNGLFATNADSSLILEPFFRIHDSRYSIYWMTATQEEYKNMIDSIKAAEDSLVWLNNRSIDIVNPGEQQSEVDHQLKSTNSNTGNNQGEFWRDANNGSFCYTLRTNKHTNAVLMIRYWGNEEGPRKFDILIDGQKLTTENLTNKWNKSEFINVIYPLPSSLLKGKSTIKLCFKAYPQNTAGGIYNIRLLKNILAKENK
jgi:DUF1680 family protein